MIRRQLCAELRVQAACACEGHTTAHLWQNHMLCEWAQGLLRAGGLSAQLTLVRDLSVSISVAEGCMVRMHE